MQLQRKDGDGLTMEVKMFLFLTWFYCLNFFKKCHITGLDPHGFGLGVVNNMVRASVNKY